MNSSGGSESTKENKKDDILTEENNDNNNNNNNDSSTLSEDRNSPLLPLPNQSPPSNITMDNVPIDQKIRIESLLNEHLQYSKSIDAAMQYINERNDVFFDKDSDEEEEENDKKILRQSQLLSSTINANSTNNNIASSTLHEVVDASHKIFDYERQQYIQDLKNVELKLKAAKKIEKRLANKLINNKKKNKEDIMRLKDLLHERDIELKEWKHKLIESDAEKINFKTELTTFKGLCKKYEQQLNLKDKELEKRKSIYERKLKETKLDHEASERQLRDAIDTLNAHLKEVEKTHMNDHRLYEKQLDEAHDRTTRLLERCKANEISAKSCREQSEKFAHDAQVANEKLHVSEEAVHRLESSILLLKQKFKSSQKEVEKIRYNFNIKWEKGQTEIKNLKTKLFHKEQLAEEAKAAAIHQSEIKMMEQTEKFEDELDILNETITKLKNEKNMLQSQCQHLAERTESVESRYQKQIDDLQTKLRQNNQKMDVMKSKQKDDILDLENKIAYHQNIDEEKSRTINDLTRELNTTKVNMDDDSKRYEKEISSLEEKLAQYQKSLQQHQGQVQLLENSLTDHKEEIEAHKNEIYSHKEIIENHQNELLNRKEELAKRDNKLTELSLSVHDHQNQLKLAQSTHESQLRAKDNVVNNLKQEHGMKRKILENQLLNEQKMSKAQMLELENNKALEINTLYDKATLEKKLKESDTETAHKVMHTELKTAYEKISKLESSLQLHQQHIKDQENTISEKHKLLEEHMNKNNKDNGMLRKEDLIIPRATEVKTNETSTLTVVDRSIVNKLEAEINALNEELKLKDKVKDELNEMISEYKKEMEVLKNIIQDKDITIKEMENKHKSTISEMETNHKTNLSKTKDKHQNIISNLERNHTNTMVDINKQHKSAIIDIQNSQNTTRNGNNTSNNIILNNNDDEEDISSTVVASTILVPPTLSSSGTQKLQSENNTTQITDNMKYLQVELNKKEHKLQQAYKEIKSLREVQKRANDTVEMLKLQVKTALQKKKNNASQALNSDRNGNTNGFTQNNISYDNNNNRNTLSTSSSFMADDRNNMMRNSQSIISYLSSSMEANLDLQQAKVYIRKLEDDVKEMKVQYRHDLQQQASEINDLLQIVEQLQRSKQSASRSAVSIKAYATLQKRNEELESRLDRKSEEMSILKVELQKIKFAKDAYEKRLNTALGQLSELSTMVEQSAKPTEVLHDNLREMVDRIRLLEVEKKFMLSRMQEQALVIHRLTAAEEEEKS